MSNTFKDFKKKSIFIEHRSKMKTKGLTSNKKGLGRQFAQGKGGVGNIYNVVTNEGFNIELEGASTSN